MRVLALSTSYPKHPADSTAPFVRAISHGLCKHGLEVHLLVPQHPDLDWAAGDPPVHLHAFSYAPRRWRRLHVWGYAGALVADTTLRPETIAVLPLAVASSRMALARLARRIEPHVLHAHWLLPNAPIAASVAGRLGKPLVVSLHGSGAFMAERHPVLARAARFALRQASHVTACSRDLASRAVRLGAPEESVTAIPYGVEASAFAPATGDARARARLELGVADDTFVILAVGRLVAKKGFEFLIRALETIQDSGTQPLLVIAGEGDLESRLKDVASESGTTERVVFLGNVDRERIGRLFAAADTLAVPSIHDDAGNVDGLPNVVLEGLASGLPLVASGIAGIPDVIRHEQNGLLVPEKESGALSSALRRLAVDPGLRHRLGGAARRVVEESLDWDSITARYARILAEAAGAEQPA
jgi:glycosyltransferase involved in cell wall biosynthesis